MVTLKLLSGTEDLKCHDTIRETMCSKVDYTIKYIRDQLNITEDTLDWKPLDSETLNLVGNFVQNGDQGLGLGNLYRTITAQGEVKWICLDHYRNIHQSLLTERLSGVGLAHVDNHLGRVSIQLSREEAKDFYKGLRKTPTVYALCIAFSVNATEADLQGLCNAIQASNVAVLSLSDPALDSTAVRSHTSHRLAPLVKLLASGRLQALHTRGSELLYSTLGETSMTIPKLHELQLGIEDISQDIGQRFASLVQSFPRLKHLSLDCDDMKMAFELILAHIEGLQFLSTLTLSTVLNTSVLHRETMVWEWSSVGCNFDDILQIDDEPMSIILPYIEDTLADDIVWFDTLFERRQSQLRVAFVGGRSETIVEVEYRHPESDHNGIVGQYLHGLHSAMYVRWREIRSRESLGWQSSGQDAVALDFQAMKNQGIRRILQSVDMLEPTELQVALCKMDEPVVQLVVSSIRPTSWVNLTRLDLRGRGCDLDNWIVGFVNYGPCFSRVAMPSLRVLCLVGAASVLSDDSVKWIESMLWRDSTEVQALDTITLESIDLTEGQWDTVLSAIELPEVKFLSFAGSTIGLIHIEILLKDLPIGAKLAHLVLNNIGWVKDLKDARSKDLKELELELFKKSALARMHN
ncbi:hypothetical protein BGX31_009570 [Mortierella sp. GBA43]|nr:hypothetical protein BGX31_009570 [Mortierella sp. GBA43]